MSELRDALHLARSHEAHASLQLARVHEEGGPRCVDDTIALGHAHATMALAAAVVGMLSKFTDQEEPQEDVNDVAEAAYAEYARSTGGRNFLGGRMPDWWCLPEDIRMAWVAAVTRARR